MMNESNALQLADQTILQLRRNNYIRAVWLVGNDVRRTPASDTDITAMLGNGARLVGIFTPAVDRAYLRDAIMETAQEGANSGV